MRTNVLTYLLLAFASLNMALGGYNLHRAVIELCVLNFGSGLLCLIALMVLLEG